MMVGIVMCGRGLMVGNRDISVMVGMVMDGSGMMVRMIVV